MRNNVEAEEYSGQVPLMQLILLAHKVMSLSFQFPYLQTGEGNGNPLQYSCLENPRDWRACWAAVYGVALIRHD